MVMMLLLLLMHDDGKNRNVYVQPGNGANREPRSTIPSIQHLHRLSFPFTRLPYCVHMSIPLFLLLSFVDILP